MLPPAYARFSRRDSHGEAVIEVGCRLPAQFVDRPNASLSVENFIPI